MKVGVFLGSQHPPEADIRREFEHTVEQTRAIRDAGFDSLWLGQHYLTYPNQFLQTTPLLARLAAETGDMAVGTNMILLPLHNVVDIAEQYATMDVISGGRLILGVGLGYRDIEFQGLAADRETRAPRFEEQITALKLLWEEDDATFEGEHVKFKNLSIRPKPLQKPRPEIWIGATADPAIKRAARMGDAWAGTSVTTFGEIKRQLPIYRQAREEAGLPPPQDIARNVEVFVAETRKKAWEEGGQYIVRKFETYFSWGMDKNIGDDGNAEMSLEDLAEDRFIIGDPEDCIRGCLEHRDAGITHLQIRLNFPGIPNESAITAIKLFGKEVLPHLR